MSPQSCGETYRNQVSNIQGNLEVGDVERESTYTAQWNTLFHYTSQKAGQRRKLILTTLKPNKSFLRNEAFLVLWEIFSHRSSKASNVTVSPGGRRCPGVGQALSTHEVLGSIPSSTIQINKPNYPPQKPNIINQNSTANGKPQSSCKTDWKPILKTQVSVCDRARLTPPQAGTGLLTPHGQKPGPRRRRPRTLTARPDTSLPGQTEARVRCSHTCRAHLPCLRR